MISTPYMQGSQAFLNDMPTSACAFAQGSTMQREWVEGWSHRQMRERAHRSRAIGEMNVPNLLGDSAPTVLTTSFHPMGEMD